MFVCILHAPDIDSPHVGKVNQSAQHRLYRLATDFAYASSKLHSFFGYFGFIVGRQEASHFIDFVFLDIC
jgi:hypothetical protein